MATPLRRVREQAQKPRARTRFQPESDTQATVTFKKSPNSPLDSYSALVVNESYTGCCLMILRPRQIEVGDFCRVKLGQLSEMPAQVVWIANLDADVVKIGILFKA